MNWAKVNQKSVTQSQLPLKLKSSTSLAADIIGKNKMIMNIAVSTSTRNFSEFQRFICKNRYYAWLDFL